jgi:hypothetical protein
VEAGGDVVEDVGDAAEAEEVATEDWEVEAENGDDVVKEPLRKQKTPSCSSSTRI